MIPIKILLVEDSPTQATFSKRELQTIGPQVTIELAQSVKEARQKVNEFASCLDLVILDLILPDGSGLTMCQELKSDLHTNKIPVVIFSREALSKHRQAAYDVGANHYISKGGTGDTTLRLVAATLLRNKLRKLPRIGEALVEKRYITIEQLQLALSTQKPSNLLGQILIELGFINQSQLEEVLTIIKSDNI